MVRKDYYNHAGVIELRNTQLKTQVDYKSYFVFWIFFRICFILFKCNILRRGCKEQRQARKVMICKKNAMYLCAAKIQGQIRIQRAQNIKQVAKQQLNFYLLSVKKFKKFLNTAPWNMQ